MIADAARCRFVSWQLAPMRPPHLERVTQQAGRQAGKKATATFQMKYVMGLCSGVKNSGNRCTIAVFSEFSGGIQTRFTLSSNHSSSHPGVGSRIHEQPQIAKSSQVYPHCLLEGEKVDASPGRSPLNIYTYNFRLCWSISVPLWVPY
jgi:hypothetical protein